MRYLITFSYNGNYFKGYQRQQNAKTVQGDIEKVLTKLNNNEVVIHASGRTDVGVHAIQQKAHFDFDKNISLDKLKRVLNSSFDNEIYIKKIEIVSNDFHARYDVASKEYRYYINTGEANIFMKDYEYQYGKRLNVLKMKQAAKYLIGEHNFKIFCTDSKEKINYIRTINKITIRKIGNIIEIRFIGTGFLKHMIRNIIGCLIEIGNNNKQPIFIEQLLNLPQKEYSVKKAPSCGLYLWDVKYK